MTMESAAVPIDPVELQPLVPDEPTPAADDIVDVCGLGSFPASDPPSWWT